MSKNPLQFDEPRFTLLMGWYDRDDLFVAWDPTAHQHPGYSTSIQVRAPFLARARELGMTIQHREQPAENVVVVHQNLLSAYIEKVQLIHGRQGNDLDETLPELDTQQIEGEDRAARGTQSERESEPVPGAGKPHERRRILSTLRRWWRSTTFPEAVKWAYKYRCAICGIDLDLIDAAHIVPVTEDDATEHPSNGLALCPLHHRAYDAGIVGVSGDLEVVLNKVRIAQLQGRSRATGLDRFLEITPIGQQIAIPDYEPYRPDRSLLSRAITIRGF